MPKLMLIDGHSLTYRAFFALPTDMATTSGQVTNAVFGFTSMLINLIRDHEPDQIAVAFDLPEPTFRHESYSDYKAGRTAAPDILRQQLGLVRQVVETLAIPILDRSGFEADDVIATLATRARDTDTDVIVVTGDRDAYQLVEDPHIKVLYNKRGVSDYALYDEAGIVERTGVKPTDYVEYAALRGDKSDNLDGVPGVGEKTAAKLINTHGGIDGIYENLDAMTPKLRENLTLFEPQVRRNLELMPLLRDVDIDAEIVDLQIGGIDAEAVRTLFDFLEFRALYDRLNVVLGFDGGPALSNVEVLEAEVVRAENPAEAVAAIGSLGTSATSIAGELADGVLEGLAIVTDSQAGDVLWLSQALLHNDRVRDALRNSIGSVDSAVSGHDIKALLRALAGLDVEVPGLWLDTAIAAYLLEPAESSYPLGSLLTRFASLELPEGSAPPDGQLDFAGDTIDVALLRSREALAVSRLTEPLAESLADHGLTGLNADIEVPLIRVLARMEHIGIGVDVAVLTEIRDGLVADTERLRTEVVDAAGEDFNINSTKQLREIMFDKLELTPQKKTAKGEPSTDAATLEKLRDEHPMVDLLLQYREVEKLRSTYGVGLLKEVGPGDRIRATFNQTVARTGRLSSDAPNLHNIPVRSERGRAFRKAFVPADGFVMLVADYNQIELRCIAHLAEDPGLIGAFEAGDDIHNATASRVFDVAPDTVTVEQRSKAKMVSYGLAYGMEAFGLATRLDIPTGEAQEILDAYFEAFPAVQSYMDNTIAEARERGYTETLFGRRRNIPELSSSNFRIRQAGERQAMNAGIQGLAADIFKVALVNLDAALAEATSESRITLQVHDEVVLEVPPGELPAIEQLVTTVMADAFDLRVPLDVNLATGDSWAAAKG